VETGPAARKLPLVRPRERRTDSSGQRRWKRGTQGQGGQRDGNLQI